MQSAMISGWNGMLRKISIPSLEAGCVTLEELLGKGQPFISIHSSLKKPTDLLKCLQAEHLLKIFPPATRRMQEHLGKGRWGRIETACYLLDDADCPFTTEELRRCKHKDKVAAPGTDGISYSMIESMGPGADMLPWPHKQNM